MPVGKSYAMDFTNVRDGGQFNPLALDPGQYPAKIVDANEHLAKSGNLQIVFTVKVDGHSGTYPYYCAIADDAENQFWKMRGIHEAAGIEIPKKRMKVNPDKLIGRPIGVELADDEYEGRIKSTIVALVPISEVGGEIVVDDEDDDDEDDAPPARTRKPAAKSRRAAPEPEDDDDDDDEDDDPAPQRGRTAKKTAPAPRGRRKPEPEPEPEPTAYDEDELNELGSDELLEIIAEAGWTKPRKKRGSTDDDYADQLTAFILEQQDEAEEEPEPEPEPAPRRGRATKSAAKKPAATTRRRSARAAVDEDDDLDDIDIDEV